MENIIKSKRCSRCGVLEPCSKFYHSKSSKDGFNAACKVCCDKTSAIWHNKHPKNRKENWERWFSKAENKAKTNVWSRQWNQRHSEQVKLTSKNWAKNNPERMRELQKKWKDNNWQHLLNLSKKYRSTPHGALNCRMTAHVRLVLHGHKSGRTWQSLVGYTVEELKKHLESLFVDGMSWNNMGQWHIDHIIPKSRFHYEKPEDPEFKICWALVNLQPLWGKDNDSKGSKTMAEWQQYKQTITGGAGTAIGGLQV